MGKGIIFNIQKFSTNDGPGVRTTVFFKGCPLISGNSGKCVKCLMCVQECPFDALSYEGEEKTVEEVVEIYLQDKDFYETSGGGVTISGGEGMSQPEFLEELALSLKEQGIHLAIETTGYARPQVFRKLVPLFDLLLFDVKHYDSHLHSEGTHVGNEQIVENLKWAVSQGIQVLPRIPVIPGFNGSLEDAAGIAALLKQAGAARVQLLPFHQFGENKYHKLCREYEYEHMAPLHESDLAGYQQISLEHGIDAFF